jgi:hypothetical protein
MQRRLRGLSHFFMPAISYIAGRRAFDRMAQALTPQLWTYYSLWAVEAREIVAFPTDGSRHSSHSVPSTAMSRLAAAPGYYRSAFGLFTNVHTSFTALPSRIVEVEYTASPPCANTVNR